MSGIQTIDLVHVRSGHVRIGWDKASSVNKLK
jgi:hypothetical protein